jgi:hypothetical protein
MRAFTQGMAKRVSRGSRTIALLLAPIVTGCAAGTLDRHCELSEAHRERITDHEPANDIRATTHSRLARAVGVRASRAADG